MEKAIVGRKLGMTQVFSDNGLMIPVTVVLAGPMTVLRKKSMERDGYSALVCAFEDVAEKKLSKPELGVFKKNKQTPKKIIKEFKFSNVDNYEVGSEIKCDIFAAGDMVDVIGTTKGRGFSGAIKRWNNHRLKMTHGTGPVHRERGSTGANSTPSKVIKGLHMAGHYGNERVTIQNLRVVKVDLGRNVILVKGGIPGAKDGLVTIRQAVKHSK